MGKKYYFDPCVHLAMEEEIERVQHIEDKDDARQEAYLAIADESPLTVEDAIACVKRAVGRYRKRLLRYESRVIRYSDSGRYCSEDGEPICSDDIRGRLSWIDYEQPDTDSPPKHGPEYFKAEYKKTLADKESDNAVLRMHGLL